MCCCCVVKMQARLSRSMAVVYSMASKLGSKQGVPSSDNCKQHTAPRTHANIFWRVAEGSRTLSCMFFVWSQNSHPRERISCRTLCLTAPFFRCNTTLRSLSPCSILRRGQILVQHRKDSCLAVLPNRAPLAGYEPNALVEVNSTEVTTTLLPSRKKQELVRLTTLARTSSLLLLYRR